MNSIAQIVVGLPVEGPFDYNIPEEAQADLQIGQRVVVPFGRRDVMGYVVGLSDQSTFSSLKDIKRVLDAVPIISAELLQLVQWMAQYYGCSWGEAIETIIPFSVRNRKKLKLNSEHQKISSVRESDVSLFLAHDNQKAMDEIIKQAQENLAQDKGVLFLAPDHSVSQKVFDFVSNQLKQKIARLDLGISKEQIADWVSLKNGETLCAIGLRSAVFAPIANLGLVVVFEEHYYGYKEDQTPYYHARDVILERSQIEGFNVVFVSSAPTVELWSEMSSSGCELVSFSKEDMAELKLVDLANYKPRKESSLSFPAVTAVSQVLDNGGKVLVLFNRRGFNTVIKCSGCGHVLRCERCEVPLTYIDEKNKMTCSSCDAEINPIKKCPQCNGGKLDRYGDGIERVESDLAKFLFQAKLATFDRDTKRMSRSANVIVATQAIFKILDQMEIDVAVVLDVDAELSRHDFRAHQKVFSMLMDLRKNVRDGVYVQTRQPFHPALSCARSMDLEKFYTEELQARKDLGFPPYQHLFEIMVRGKDETLTIEQADIIYELFLERSLKGFEVMPPQPSARAKLRDQYRYTIMGKGLKELESMAHVKAVLKDAKKKRGVIVTVNVDP